MIRLALLVARADLRRAPGRAVAVAALLLTAAVLPGVLGAGTVAGLALAVVVATSATAGAAAAHERRARVLAESGAGSGAQVLVAAASLVVPGLVATVAATAVGVAGDGAPGPAAALAIALLVPLAVGTTTAWATAPGASLGRRGTAAVAVLVALTAPLLVVPLVLLAVLVGPRLGRARPRVRLAVTIVAAAVTLGAAVLMSRAESFFDLGAVLLLSAAPLTLAVGWLGTAAVAAVAALVARLGPTARLATAPLGRRRHQLGPIAAVVAVVVTLAAAEGVVGASFEEREAARGPAAVLGRAGTDDGQAIVITTGLDPADERSLVAEEAAGAPVQVAVIDRVGGGGTEAVPTGTWASDSPVLDFGSIGEAPPEVAVPVGSGPSWVGVVAADALAPLGLDAHAEALARGDALVLNPDVVAPGGRVEVAGAGAGPLTIPVVRASERAGLLLPAVLVSEARAEELGAFRNGARVAVVADPTAPPDTAAAIAAGVRDRLADPADQETAPVSALDSLSDFGAILEQALPVAGGDDLVREPDIAPLDEVPALARTAEQGQGRAVTFGALAVLVALAGTLLVVGGARSDDAVLLVQGAPDRHRVTTAVVQTATVALAGTLLGAVVGLGVPALAIRLYNGRSRDARTLDIPFVVPPALVVVLLALPVVAAVLAAAVVAGRGRPTPQLLADAARG
jgi:hypothetical protein